MTSERRRELTIAAIQPMMSPTYSEAPRIQCTFSRPHVSRRDAKLPRIQYQRKWESTSDRTSPPPNSKKPERAATRPTKSHEPEITVGRCLRVTKASHRK